MRQAIYHKGKQVTVGENYPQALVPYINFSGDIMEYLESATQYKRLDAAFPWVQTYRAGMIILRKDADGCKLLLVRQSRDAYAGDAVVKLPARYGLPKGSRKETYSPDLSAIGTALREVKEEIGVDLKQYGEDVTLLPGILVFPYNQISMQEVHIWITAVFRVNLDIVICGEEIVGYQWVDVTRNISTIETNYASAEVLRFLEENVDLYNL
jgi:8-oxo-dGTP pyrophosphatase MutT (NUDIX family)